MCGSAPSVDVLLCIVGMIVSAAQGEVTAPASLSAVVGLPFTLGCNISTGPGDAVRQVRWLDAQGQLLLAYRPADEPAGVRVSAQLPGVELVASDGGRSVITVGRARPGDEGCYRCLFDVYPSGAQEGKTCLSVTTNVETDGNQTAVSGERATLACRYGLPERVKQVLWRKTAEQGDTARVAHYAKQGQPAVDDAFRPRLTLSRSLSDSRLSVRPVRTEDEGCYTCEFNTYPDGARSATTCLSVYVLPKPELTAVTLPSGVVEANCTAQSRPAAELTWSGTEAENRTLGPPVTSAYDQGDGTTLVTSTLLLHAGPLSDLAVKCIVHHQGLDKPIAVALNTNVGPALVVLLTVCGIAAVLLLCLCICLCKCFVCTED